MLHRVCLLAVLIALALVCSGKRISTSYGSSVELASTALHAYWKLDDLNTYYQNVVDEVGGPDGLLVGVNAGDWEVGLDDTFAVDGFSMRALTGSADGYVLLPNAPFDAVWNAGPWSLDFWIRLQTFPSAVAETQACDTTFMIAVSATGELSVTFGTTTVTSSAGVITTDTWAYITVDVTSQGDLIASVNGIEVDSATLSSTPTSSGCSVAFGKNAAVGSLFDEVALHNASSDPVTRRRLYYTGIALGCRTSPCYSGVSCTPQGAVSYSCGDCPSGYTGDGENCEIGSALKSSLRLGDCLPTSSDLDDVFYCRDHCSTRRKCFLCGMSYSGRTMWAVRDACYIPTPTPSPSASPSVSPPPPCYDWVQAGGDMLGKEPQDQMGTTMAINAEGNIVASGGPYNTVNGSAVGYTRVFEYIDNDWVQLGADIVGGSGVEHSGISVSLNAAGDIVAIGATAHTVNGNDVGAVRMYHYTGGSWLQMGATIEGKAHNDFFGWSVSLNGAGDVVVISAIYHDGSGVRSGQVQVYEYNGGNWVQRGGDIDGEAAHDEFGHNVAINAAGDVIAAGAYNNDGNGEDSGHARVYDYTGGNWVQRGPDFDGENAGDGTGAYVALNDAGDIVAVGTIYSNNFSGHTKIYEYNGVSWTQQGSTIHGKAQPEFSGAGVSLNGAGDIISIGALLIGPSFEGGMRVYQFSEGDWMQVGEDVISDEGGAQFGLNTVINSAGNRIASGAGEHSGRRGVLRVYDFALVSCDS